jgi:hypothetical protein
MAYQRGHVLVESPNRFYVRSHLLEISELIDSTPVLLVNRLLERRTATLHSAFSLLL